MILLSAALMHIPDGFLSVTISVLFWALTAVALATAVRRSQALFDERLAPWPVSWPHLSSRPR